MKILNQHQIQQKVKRLAIQILENNVEEEGLILAGINERGMRFASLLFEQLQTISEMPLQLTNIQINPQNPLSPAITVGMPVKEMNDKVVIVIDDVANTGRTLFYAFKPLLEVLPKRLETVVLVDRKHKLFPIRVDYVGLSLATTLHENISVQILDETADIGAFLD